MESSQATSLVASPLYPPAAARVGTACPIAFVSNMGRPLIHRAHAQTPSFGTAYHFAISVRDLLIPNFPSRFLAHKLCLGAQFDGFTEVSRCGPDGNSWCCAGSQDKA